MQSFLRSPRAAYVLLPTAAAGWAGNHVLARAIAGHVPAGALCFARWCALAVLIAAIAWPALREDWPKVRARPWPVLFLGLVGGGAFGTLQFIALHYTTALNMGVVGSVAPAFIVSASFLLFGDRMGRSQLAGVGVSFLGVIAIVSRLQPEALAGLALNVGDLIVIINMVLWAVYSACLRLRPPMSTISFMFALAVVGAVANIPVAVWEHARGERLHLDLLTLTALAYSALVSTLLGYVCWNRGVELVGAQRASAFLHTVPVFGAIFATSILGERIEAYHLVGFALILAGVTLAARPATARAASAS